jgi:hypothetical protein
MAPMAAMVRRSRMFNLDKRVRSQESGVEGVGGKCGREGEVMEVEEEERMVEGWSKNVDKGR